MSFWQKTNLPAERKIAQLSLRGFCCSWACLYLPLAVDSVSNSLLYFHLFWVFCLLPSSSTITQSSIATFIKHLWRCWFKGGPYIVISAIESYADYIQDIAYLHQERARTRIRTKSRAQAFLAWGEKTTALALHRYSWYTSKMQEFCAWHKCPRPFLSVSQQ